MTESAVNIVAGFRTLRKFCESVGELLDNANELMKEEGWKPIKKIPVFEVCSDLESANTWLPDTFFCYYTHAEHQHRLPFVAVLLDDLIDDDPDPNCVKEPLISAGWADYPIGSNAKKELGDEDFRIHYGHLWLGNRRDDGTVSSGDAKNLLEDEEDEDVVSKVVEITTFAHPLELITDSESLKQKVVQPLLNLLSKAN